MSEDSKTRKSSLVVRTAADLTLKFPEPQPSLAVKDAEKTKDVIRKHGAYDLQGGSLLSTKSLPKLLVTDVEGAKRFFMRLNDDDKVKDGNNSFAKGPAVLKEIAQRIEAPRDAYVHERLKYNEECLKKLRDAPEIERIRVLLESKIRRELPNLKQLKINAGNISECQVSGDALEADAHAHHKERKSDNPHRALDLDNIIIVNEKPHQIIHQAKAGDDASLKELCIEKGWKLPSKP